MVGVADGPPATPAADATPASPDTTAPADAAAPGDASIGDATPGDTSTGDAIGGDASGDTLAKVVSMLQIRPTDPHMRTGELLPLLVTAFYDDASSAEVAGKAAWTSSNTTVATVDLQGQVTALTGGTSVIKAAYQGKEASVTVTVRMVTPSSVMLSPAQVTLEAAETAALSAVLVFSDGSSKDVTPDATWKSSSTAVADVSTAGVVTGKGGGSATITATHLGLSGTATVTVTSADLVALLLSPTSLSVPAGQSKFLAVTGEFADGTQRNLGTRASWSSSNTAVATVGSGATGGMVTGTAAGTATITAAYGGLTATATVTVP